MTLVMYSESQWHQLVLVGPEGDHFAGDLVLSAFGASQEYRAQWYLDHGWEVVGVL